MLSFTESLFPEAPPPAGRSGGYPFRGPGLLTRVAPFAVVAVLAEASLALARGPLSAWAVFASVVLLLAVAAAFALPWPRLPVQLMVLVPLAYCGSLLALVLAAGVTSGLTAVVLVPLVWTALFQRRWESACVVAAVAAVEVTVSLTPVVAQGPVIARRVVLWVLLGALVSVAAHGLRDRIQLSREKSAQLQDRLRELTLTEDRDRIAADLRDKVIQRIFAAGLTLQGTTARVTDPAARRWIQESIDDLDQAIWLVRDTVFDLNHRFQDHRLRAEILDLCRDLLMAPELSFSGTVEGSLQPGDTSRLLAVLREALDLIGQHYTPSRIGIVAGEDSLLTVVDAASAAQAARASGGVHHFTSLREKALQAGIGLHIEPGPQETRFRGRADRWVVMGAWPGGRPTGRGSMPRG